MADFTTAKARFQAGRYAEAVEILNEFLAADPADESGWRLLGACHFQQRQYAEAEGALRRCAPVIRGQYTHFGEAVSGGGAEAAEAGLGRGGLSLG